MTCVVIIILILNVKLTSVKIAEYGRPPFRPPLNLHDL